MIFNCTLGIFTNENHVSFFFRPSSVNGSYEDLSDDKENLELTLRMRTDGEQEIQDEVTPLDKNTSRRMSNRMPKLVRQSSIMETPIDEIGAMKMTYWF